MSQDLLNLVFEKIHTLGISPDDVFEIHGIAGFIVMHIGKSNGLKMDARFTYDKVSNELIPYNFSDFPIEKRKTLVKEVCDSNFGSQNKVSDLFGISQATVNNYLKKNR